jgi:two-component system cell cycle sensor histidine kinase/response regulator CckA
VVEDDPQILSLLEATLRQRGHRVWIAPNAAIARRVFAEVGSEIDFVVSDVTLPDARAPDLVRELRLIRPELRAVFSSGYPQRALEHECQLMNDALLRKPFEMVELLALLEGA